MNDIFDEYGSVLIAVVVAIVLVGAGIVFFRGDSALSQWVTNYINSLGG